MMFEGFGVLKDFEATEARMAHLLNSREIKKKKKVSFLLLS